MSLELSQVEAVVLAGGFGTRIAHLLEGVPKPMVPVGGRPFLEWVVRYLARQRIPKVILSTGHLAEVIEAHFQPQPVAGVRGNRVCQGPDQAGDVLLEGRLPRSFSRRLGHG